MTSAVSRIRLVRVGIISLIDYLLTTMFICMDNFFRAYFKLFNKIVVTDKEKNVQFYGSMIYVTQLIYVKAGQEELFYEFENVVLPLLWKYKGQLLLRLRPTISTFVDNSIEPPFEIHLVAFESEQDLEQYSQDEERKSYLHLKEQSVRSVVLIKGTQVVP